MNHKSSEHTKYKKIDNSTISTKLYASYSCVKVVTLCQLRVVSVYNIYCLTNCNPVSATRSVARLFKESKDKKDVWMT